MQIGKKSIGQKGVDVSSSPLNCCPHTASCCLWPKNNNTTIVFVSWFTNGWNWRTSFSLSPQLCPNVHAFWGSVCPTPSIPWWVRAVLRRVSAAALSLFLPYAAVVWDAGNRYSGVFIHNNVIKPRPPNWMKLQKQLSQSISKASLGVPTLKGKLRGRCRNIYSPWSVPVCSVCCDYTEDAETPAVLTSSRNMRNANFALH